MRKAFLFSATIMALLSTGFPAFATEVVASIRPVHSLVAAVMGETGTPALLIDQGETPHGFNLKPSHMRMLRDADLIFYIHPDFETSLARAFGTLSSGTERIALADSTGLTLLPSRSGGAWSPHEHHDHDHADHDHDANHSRASTDYHVWLDPQNATVMVSAIATALGRVDPKHAETYQANAAETIRQIRSADDATQARLSGVTGTPFIVFHDAYQYFESRYGLNGAGSITFEPTESPSMGRIQEIRNTIEERGVSCVFTEPQLPRSLLSTILHGSAASSAALDPLGYDLTPGPSLYVQLLETMGTTFAACLSSRK